MVHQPPVASTTPINNELSRIPIFSSPTAHPISEHPLDSSTWTLPKCCHFTETLLNPQK